ncbi:unnamed protein product, partial [Rotaria magnacalcarata]
MYRALITFAIVIGIVYGQEHFPPVAYGEACVTQGFHSGHQAIDIGSYGAKRVNLFTIWDGTVIG